MRFLAPFVPTLAALAVLVPATAAAVTLEQYFFGFSDRDRGVYLTGVLDLFAADSSRDPEYRHCVSELGAAGMHEAISEIVREDPRLLSFDASLWILYEASRQCNTSAGETAVPDPRSMLPSAAESASGRAGVPNLPAAPAENGTREAPGSDGQRRLPGDWRLAVGAVLLLLMGLAGGAFVAGAMRRRNQIRRAPSRPHRPTSSSKTDERLGKNG